MAEREGMKDWLQRWGEEHKDEFPLPEGAEDLPVFDPGKGYFPEVVPGKYSLDVTNVSEYLDQPLEAPSPGFLVRLQVHGECFIKVLCCHVNDLQGTPREGVPVTLRRWQRAEEEVIMTEKKTDKEGKAEFAIWEIDLPWMSIGVGTVDGTHSLGEFKIPLDEW